MMRLIGFREWFEATVQYGNTHRDKDVNQVPPHYWNWLLGAMDEKPSWTPLIHDDDGRAMTKDAVTHLAKIRAANQPYGNTQKPMWTLAKVVNIQGLTPGEYVVATKTGDSWTILSKNGTTKKVPDASMKGSVSSVRDNGKPIQSTNSEELFAKIPQEDELIVKSTNKIPDAVEITVPGRIPASKISKYAKQIEEYFLSHDTNIMINALAGSGKSSVLKHLASFKPPGEKWLYLVFNKKNQTEATTPDPQTKARPFPAGVDVLTTHSFLGRVLESNAKAGRISKTELHDGKGQSPKLSSMLDEPWFDSKAKDELNIPWKRIYHLKMRVKELASKGKAFNVNPKNSKEAMELLDSLIDKYDIDTYLMGEEELDRATEGGREPKSYRDELVDMTYDVLRRLTPNGSPEQHYNTSRDHDDTLWWAALHADELQFPHYNVVLADEVQDFNKNQQVMLKKLMEAGAKIIAVGDPNQSIYRFRGADSSAFGNIQNIIHSGKKGATVKNLPINWRSCRKIIEYVNKVTHMSRLKDEDRLQHGLDCEGVVTEDKKYHDVLDIIKTEWDRNKKMSMSTAILARTNAPLLATAMNLLKNGIPFQIIGREFLDEITKFIKSVTGVGKNATNYEISEFRNQMNRYIQDKEEKYKGRIKKQDELAEIVTIGDSLNGVLSYLEEHGWKDPIDPHSRPISDAYGFSEFLRKRFGGLNVQDDMGHSDQYDKNKDKVVNITTGHRSKGLEFDRVFIIRNDLYLTPKGKNEEDIAQEANGQYVALTRARKELHVINDKNPGG